MRATARRSRSTNTTSDHSFRSAARRIRRELRAVHVRPAVRRRTAARARAARPACPPLPRTGVMTRAASVLRHRLDHLVWIGDIRRHGSRPRSASGEARRGATQVRDSRLARSQCSRRSGRDHSLELAPSRLGTARDDRRSTGCSRCWHAGRPVSHAASRSACNALVRTTAIRDTSRVAVADHGRGARLLTATSASAGHLSDQTIAKPGRADSTHIAASQSRLDAESARLDDHRQLASTWIREDASTTDP